jgi:biotin synthase
VIKAINKTAERNHFIQRVCVSSLTSPKAPEDLVSIVRKVKAGTGLKLSTLITPTSFTKAHFESIKAAGVQNITIAVDAATQEVFDKLRGKGAGGPHRWDRYLKGVEEAVVVMGNGRKGVGIHLIIGLGETEEEAAGLIQRCYDMGASVHLFSFYPENGSGMEDWTQPPIEQYRRVQLARHLMDRGLSRFEKMRFESGVLKEFGLPENELLSIVRNGEAFMTTGCTGCNRPFANETPTQAMKGLLRNYPFPPDAQDIRTIEKQTEIAVS